MFKKILVAYDGSAESKRALLTGIDLARSLNAELRVVSVIENLPLMAGYIDVQLPDPTEALREQATEYYRKIQGDAQQASQREGVVLMTELVEGDEVQAIVECAQRTRSDLLVVGVHRHSSLFGRLLNHTTQDLSQQVASSILSVH
jgi:nucleotide-binding universal stress UspA family protein